MNAPVNAPPKLKKRKLSPKQQKLHNFSFGAQSEQAAELYLTRSGYQVWNRNVRFRNHEVDLITFDTFLNELVFVEVKSRSQNHYGDPYDMVNRKKLRSLQIAAYRYRQSIAYHGDFRFDIITVVNNQVRHYQNVTWNWR